VLRTPNTPTHTYVLEPDNATFESRVELWLAGFGAQTVVTTDEIVAAVDRVPNHQLDGLRGIVYDPDRVTQELTPIPEPWRFRIKGAFFVSERCIVVYDFENRSRFEHILYHEIGHYVFQYILDSFKRKRWVTELYPTSRYVTPVASRNANEDFAESYATFLSEPERLLQIPGKHAFMRRDVFEGIDL
jgi:hypothetical protein